MDLERALVLAIVALLLGLSTLLVLPYVQFVLAAVVLAFVLDPLYNRLTEHVGETTAAALLVLLSVVALVFPVIVVLAFVAGDALEFASRLEQGGIDVEGIEEVILEYTGQEIDIGVLVGRSVEQFSQWLFGGVLSAVGTLTHLLIGLGLLLFLLFFFVRDGDEFFVWFREVTPIREAVLDDLLERLDNITRAVLLGHVLVAVIQGVLAGLGLVAVGIPNAIFWTFIMVVLGLLPLIGTFMIWAPASVYLVTTRRPVAGAGLFVYGAVVVGISDDYLRPVIVDRYAKVSPSVIIVGVVGGLSVFGFMGLFIGPVVIGALKGAIEVHDNHYEDHRGLP